MKTQKILGLRTAIYMVSDLEKATEWYSAVFQKEPYFNEPFYVGFDIGGYELGLLPEKEISEKKEATVITYWGVEDIEEVYARFIEAGATEHEKPHSVGEPLLVATVKDPWGNIVGFIYNPLFK